ncbi:glycosyltransferase family 8 protein [Cereibacter changlensis]|uniref:glycosyltransferase family 8 protein n=1 Tax=Cereibacter changlensis TaxID=402884 RepID=UPI004033B801
MAVTVEASRPATSRQAVVFCCDENYYPYALSAAAQIAALNPDARFDICICSLSPLPQVSPAMQQGVRTCVLSFDGPDLDFSGDARRTGATFLRIALPEALGEDYERILYLDSDIFVQRGGMNDLFRVDLGRHVLAAVRDNLQWRTNGKPVKDFETLGLCQDRYFNAGVILFDTAACRQIGLLQGAAALNERVGGKLLRHDQTLLNGLAHRRWAELSPTWNWQYTWSSRLFEPYIYPHIIHFIGGVKPWNDRSGILPQRFSRDLSSFLATVFPERAPLEIMPSLSPAAPLMAKMLVKHYLSRRRLARYLDHFSSDLSVIE